MTYLERSGQCYRQGGPDPLIFSTGGTQLSPFYTVVVDGVNVQCFRNINKKYSSQCSSK